MEAKIRRQELEVKEAEDEIGQRRLEELGTHGELLISMLTSKRRRSVSSSLTKRRMTQQAKDDFEQETEELTALQKQLDALEAEQDEAIEKAKEEWGEVASDVSEVPLNPYKKDIFVEMFGVAWAPYYQIMDGSRVREVPAFERE